MKKIIISVLTLVLCVSHNINAQKFEGLAKTPQMGWNSWNLFQTNINEQLVKEIADIFVSRGLKDAGYEYVLLDDGWMDMQRDAQDNLVPHPDKFPNGIKAVADYVHSKGLKFGLYNCAGDKTCAGYPGSHGHEYQDALKYAEWGVDYLKYDWCSTPNFTNMDDKKIYAEQAYRTMRDALHAAGRPILFSICEWGDNNPWDWASPIGHSWRTTGDISDCFDCVEEHKTPFNSWYSWGVIPILNMRDQAALRKVAGPDHWNDMDMMEIGNGGMNHIEEASHFALWAILNSPLLLGNDLRTMSQETFEVISNKEIIAINQDALGIQGFKYATLGSVEVWVKPLENDAWAIAFFNHSGEATDFVFDWTGQTIEDKDFNKQVSFSKDAICKLRDLSAKKDIGTTKKALKTKLEANQTLVVKVSKV
ncbi:hypothetical protein FACS189437_03670 [Bacteroidia bacterium]|nr:hypothetical protein FACS189437_03670 [Bacteroidia bacterium]